MISAVRQHLTDVILPFWSKLKDDENGGFFGYVGYDLNVDKKAVKGVILNSRLMWFFSNVYLTIGGQENLNNARHAYNFFKYHCLDKKYGGVYWMMNYDGTVCDDMKHTYNQAFAIYALSSYYAATSEDEALAYAYDIFETIEENCSDEYGYPEAFSRGWQLAANEALSENGLLADKTMNTLLHMLEAYSNLYRVGHNPKVEARITNLLEIFRDKVYNKKADYLEVFFNAKLESIADMDSYGHDIEATWLLDEACDLLPQSDLTRQTKLYTGRIAEHIRNTAYENGAINNERFGREINKNRIWWVQAESVVGFLNAYQKTGEDKYLALSQNLWKYIQNHVHDTRPGGEWFWQLDYNNNPIKGMPVVEPWKCPYHNGRMCIEVIKRNVDA